MRITLDGEKEIHDKRRVLCNGDGTFDVIVSNIKKFSEKGIRVKIRVNIDKENVDAYLKVKNVFKDIKNIVIYPARVTEEPTQDDTQ